LIDEIPAADPALMQDAESINVFQNVYDGLTQFGQDGTTVTPDLAKSWDISADGLTYTFHLRDDAKFSNGDPITSADFVYSWSRLLKNPNAPYGFVFDAIKGISDAADGNITDTKKLADYVDTNLPKAITTPDKYTLVITLDKPAAYFLTQTALWSWWIVDKNVVQKFADPNAKDDVNKDKDLNSLWADTAANKGGLVGSGAFTLSEWAHDQKLVLKSSPTHFEGQPALDEVDFDVIKDNQAAQQQFEAGKIDILDPIDPNDYQRLKSDAKLKTQLLEVPALRVTYFGMDATKGPLSGGGNALLLRQAFSYGIDKQALIDAALNGIGYPANSLLVGIPGDTKNSLPCYDSYDPYKFDAAKAKDLLAKAGYDTPAKLADLGKSISPYTYNTSDTQKAIAENLQAQFKQNMGIDITLANTSFKEFLVKRQNHAYTSYRDSWGADYPDPQDFLQPLAGTGQAENNEGWTNKDYDALIAKGNAASTLADRCTAYKAANKIYIDDAATIPLFFGKTVDLVDAKAAGWTNTPVNPNQFKFVKPTK
jgi:ABC-type transport system substrate-binding protein